MVVLPKTTINSLREVGLKQRAKSFWGSLGRYLVVSVLGISVSATSGAQETTLGPVILYRDAKGIPFTLDLKTEAPGNYIATKRPVNTYEIEAIRREGFDVIILDEPGKSMAPTKGLVTSIPSAFNIIRRIGQVYGTVWTGGSRPGGKSTQWLGFNYSSYGYTGEHVPVALFLDANRLAMSPPGILGNGIIIGDVHFRTIDDGGCGSSSWPGVPIYNAQIETYANPTWIYGATCLSSGLQNGPRYGFMIHANTNSWVSYWTGSETPPAVNTLAHNPTFNPDNGGVLFSSTNDSPGNGDFTLYFSNVGTGWF
jgi:hypothetical protein